jgi:hypothetical protein
MSGSSLDPNVKRTSTLRRIPRSDKLRYVEAPGLEGHVCAFRLASDSETTTVEAATGRAMALVGDEIFLATPGSRESNRILVGGVPEGGLVPGREYWMLAESGVVGELTTGTPLAKSFLTQVRYLGAIVDEDDELLTLRRFAVPKVEKPLEHGATLLLIVGTSAEVGKTTAGLTMLRTLLATGHSSVVVLKATGTSAVTEIAAYRDYGAARAYDCVDFGLPTTYPSERNDMDGVFDLALDTCLSLPADAVLIECGGDMLAANIPIFLQRLKSRRTPTKIVLAAADPLGAFGASQMLRDMGLSADLITGPCTDTPASQRRTEALCKTQAMNMLRKS